MDRFRWNDFALDKVAKHGLGPDEVESAFDDALPGYPKRHGGDDAFILIGTTHAGVMIQAIFLIDPPPFIWVFHARPLNESERRRHRRKGR